MSQCLETPGEASGTLYCIHIKVVLTLESTGKLNVIIRRTVLITHSSECCLELVGHQEKWLLHSWGILCASTSADVIIENTEEFVFSTVRRRMYDTCQPSNCLQFQCSASPSQFPQRLVLPWVDPQTSCGNLIPYYRFFAVSLHEHTILFSSIVLRRLPSSSKWHS